MSFGGNESIVNVKYRQLGVGMMVSGFYTVDTKPVLTHHSHQSYGVQYLYHTD